MLFPNSPKKIRFGKIGNLIKNEPWASLMTFSFAYRVFEVFLSTFPLNLLQVIFFLSCEIEV
jgi:hypothetical protein